MNEKVMGVFVFFFLLYRILQHKTCKRAGWRREATATSRCKGRRNSGRGSFAMWGREMGLREDASGGGSVCVQHLSFQHWGAGGGVCMW